MGRGSGAMSVLFAALCASTAFTIVHAQVTLTGKAFGAGYLKNCTITLTGTDINMTSTTDAKGSYTFHVPGVTSTRQLTGALLVVPRGESCIDSATGLQQPLPLGAMIPSQAPGAAATATVNGITTLSYYTKKNFNAPQIKPYSYFFGGQDFTANIFYKTFGSYLGIGNSELGGTADFINGVLTVDEDVKDELKGQALNNEIINSLTVGAAGLSGLKQGVTPEQAAEAMVVATFPAGASYIKQGLSFDLTRVDSLIAIFNKALGGAPQDIVKAVANTLSLMNGELKKLGEGTPSAETLDRMAQIVFAGQTIVAPAAHQLAAGNMTVEQWTTTYGTAAALDTVYAKAGKIPGMLGTVTPPTTPSAGALRPVTIAIPGVLGAAAPAMAPSIGALGPITTAVSPAGVITPTGASTTPHLPALTTPVATVGRRLLQAV